MTIPLGPQELTGNTAFATNVGLLFLRLALGVTFILYWRQLPDGTFGGPMAYLAAYERLIVGISAILVMLGLLSRLGTLPIIAAMVMTLVVTLYPASENDNPVVEVIYNWNNINLIAMSLMILLAGPGLISVDAFLFRRGLWARGPQPLSEPEKTPLVP